jgi:hypothetical protein
MLNLTGFFLLLSRKLFRFSRWAAVIASIVVVWLVLCKCPRRFGRQRICTSQLPDEMRDQLSYFFCFGD